MTEGWHLVLWLAGGLLTAVGLSLHVEIACVLYALQHRFLHRPEPCSPVRHCSPDSICLFALCVKSEARVILTFALTTQQLDPRQPDPLCPGMVNSGSKASVHCVTAWLA